MTPIQFDKDNITKVLTELFPEEWVMSTAAETNFIKRQRKVNPVVFLWALVLGFGVRLQRTLTDLRRAYQQQVSHMIVPSTFYDRFTPELVSFLKQCVERGIEHLIVEPGLKMNDKLKIIRDILVIDSTLIRLHEQLASKWPGVRTNHSPATAKVNALVSVFGATKSKVQIDEGKRAESKLLSIGDWVKDRILLLDLGCFGFNNFAKIKEHGGYFVSRLKSNSNPYINTASGQGYCCLSEIKGKLKREIFDFEVWMTTSQSKNPKVLKRSAVQLRVVGI